MMDPAGLSAIVAAFFVVAVSPGPATVAVATVSMQAGRRQGQMFGYGLGLAFWGLVAASGMGTVLQGSTNVLTAIKLLGGAYLLWLAFQSSRSVFQDKAVETYFDGNGRWFIRGLILNLSNPKAVVAWMAALSMGMGNDDGITKVAMATLLCGLVGFVIYAGYALVFSRVGIMTKYRRFRRYVDGAVAVFLAVAGIGLIRSALAR